MKTLRVTGPLVGSERSWPASSLRIWAVPGGPATLQASLSEPALHLSSCFWVVFVAPLTVLAPFPCLLASFWCLLAHALLGRRRGAAGRRPGRSPGAQGRLGRVFGRSRGALGGPKCTFGPFFKSPFFIIFGSLFWTVFGARPGPPRGAPKALPGPLGGTRWAHGQKTL